MALNFNSDSVFNLKPINVMRIMGEVNGLLIEDEQVLYAFESVRDQVLFTNRRIIVIDVQGITGQRKSYSTLPYNKVQYFSVQTHGFAEVVPDCELFVMFANGFTARFEFNGNTNIGQICKLISACIL